MEAHFGQPHHPFFLRLHSGSITSKVDGERRGAHVYYERQVKWWLGFSWRGKWFIGFMRTAEQHRKDAPMSRDELGLI